MIEILKLMIGLNLQQALKIMIFSKKNSEEIITMLQN